MKNLFSIGEVSEIKEITIKALRYYHKMGILVPKYIDEQTGYRYYSIEQFIYIDIIKGCRALGTSIAELQEIFKERNMDKLLEFLQQKRIEAEENINRMQEVIKNIDILNESIEYSREALGREQIEIRYFEKRYIVVHSCQEAGSLKELLYYSDLDKIVKENNIEITMDKGIIYNVKEGDQVEPVYVFHGIKKSDAMKHREYIKVLPAGNYLVVSYNDGNEEKRIEKLFEYAEKYRLKIKSFMELELYDDLFNTDSFSCQLQIRIGDEE